MENNWKEVKLGDYLDSISKTFKFTDKEVVFLNTSDILEGKVLNKEYVSPIGLPGQAKKSIQKGDLLFSEIRPANKRYARIDFDSEDYVVSTKLMVLRVKGDLDPIFLELYLTSEEILDYLQMIAEDRSGTFPQITFDIISKLELKLPPLPEQKAIASVLSSLDDKIDLLHQQNQTLEALAETLFRQWFIEKAKEDWEEVSLGSIIDLVVDNRGKTPPTVDYKTAYPLIEVNAINTSDCLVNYNVIRKYVVEETYNTWFRKHLNVNDVIVSTVGTIGVFSIFTSNIGCIAQNLIGLRSETVSPYFIYLFLKTNKEDILNLDIGGVQPSIKVPHLLDLKLKKPTIEVINKFHNLVKEYFNKIGANQQQIQTLTKLRDTLLPKLMSGEVRVKM